MFPAVNPETTTSWKELGSHFQQIKNTTITDLFNKESDRGEYLSHQLGDIFIDFSKNLIDRKALELLCELCEDIQLKEAIDAMFNGELINKTENRAVLHVALRNLKNDPIQVQGENVMPLVFEELKKIKDFTNALHSGKLLGHTGKPIQHIVNIGIGGSDLGPYMVVQALKPYWVKGVQPHFVSNVDASHLKETLEKIDPESSLFIIASKSFTTQETMTNAHSARKWFLEQPGMDESAIAKHFVAISTNSEKVKAFGIDTDNMFIFWDWVGGRYSLWSSIGLSIAATIGYQRFEELLDGAQSSDDHFRNTNWDKNIPVLMGLIGVWYNNFFETDSHAILPYDHLLHHFSKYLQQGDMESNGKQVDRNGSRVRYQTGPIIWGEPGTNGQHAFYQLIHQGTKFIPCDFLAAAQPAHEYQNHQEILVANFIAQTEALVKGKSREEVEQELRDQGLSESEIQQLAPYKVFEGNKPTTSILMKKLTPFNLGALIALYEHKIFVQGIIWNIYSFDQWGVELGKQLAGSIVSEIQSKEVSGQHDASTNAILKKYLAFQA
jgi:glucose-6-phosphate isomerase